MGKHGAMVIGQSGGPTAVINSSVWGAIQQARAVGITRMYGMLHGVRGLLREDLVDLNGEDPATLAGLAVTPSAALGSCRFKLTDKDHTRLLEVCRAHDIRYLLYAGGGDTMHSLHEIQSCAAAAGYAMSIVGIPKTIDNDLVLTDHSPGYGSAARFVATMFSEVVRDTRALRHTEVVKVVETMGRNAGWLTAAAALADDYAPDLTYVPERPFDEHKFLADVERVAKDRGCVVIAACEGLVRADGTLVAAFQDAINVDAFGHPELGGLGQYLVDLAVSKLRLKARLDKPGTMQRASGVCASTVDRAEAYEVGAAAARHAVAETSGHMVTLVRSSSDPYVCTTGLADLELVAGGEKHLPDEFINAAGNGVTVAFKDYARPLIGGALPPYVTLAGHPVKKKAAAFKGEA